MVDHLVSMISPVGMRARQSTTQIKHMFWGREIDKFEMRRVNHLQVELKEGYWAKEWNRMQLSYCLISTRLTSKHDGNLS